MKITTIIPTYKDRGYLKHAIKSIQNQTYKNHQFLIGKGGTVGANINSCIPFIKGDIVHFMGDDDLLPSYVYQTVVDNFKGDMMHGNSIRFKDPYKMIIAKPSIVKPTLEEMIKNNALIGGTCYYKREIFDEWDETLTTAEEYDFNLRKKKEGAKVQYLNEILYFYRIHEKQKSIGNKDKDYQAKRDEVKRTIKLRYI
jgi:glycosyltransferase involved in cell wall biosynthesis